MAQTNIQLTGILQNHNQNPQSDQKYQLLRKSLRNSRQKVIDMDIDGVSSVSSRFHTLTPEQAQAIKKTTLVPVNFGLRPTTSKQKQQTPIQRQYIAIDMEQKQQNKPISPNTFSNIVKDQKTEIVYEYYCSNGQLQSQFNPGSSINKDYNSSIQVVRPSKSPSSRILYSGIQSQIHKNAKLSKILQDHNQNPQDDQKYDPLRKNIRNSKQKVVQKEINQISYVSGRLRSLSIQKADLIKNTTFIPVDCGLKVTNDEEKQHLAKQRRYVAIEIEQKVGSKPISPKTFERLPKNKKTEIVYEYQCPQGEYPQQHYNFDLSQSKKICGGGRQNYQFQPSNQAFQFYRQKNNSGIGGGIYTGTIQKATSPAENQKGQWVANSPQSGQIGIKGNALPSSKIVYSKISGPNTIEPNINQIQTVHQNPIIHNTVVGPSDSKIISSRSPNHAQIYAQSSGIKKAIQTNTQSPRQMVRDNTSSMRNLQQKIQGNVYSSQEYRTGGYSEQYIADDGNVYLDGPAFFQTQGRNNYRELANITRQQYENSLKKQGSLGNIAIGGRNKASTKHTIEESESNIGLNSRHNAHINIASTREYSRRELNKQEATDGQGLKVTENLQSVQSRIIIGGGNPQSQQQISFNLKMKGQGNNGERNYEMLRGEQQKLSQNKYSDLALNVSKRVAAEPVYTSPELQERKKKLSEYQSSGAQGYNFKKNAIEDSQPKRKKDEYKYNLYSMLDEQFNLKCATGVCRPNQICASSPKRQGWK